MLPSFSFFRGKSADRCLFLGSEGGEANERLEGPWPGLRPALGVGLGGYTAVVTNQEMRNDS